MRVKESSHREYLNNYKQVLDSIEFSAESKAGPNLHEAIKLIASQVTDPKSAPRVFFIGNGGSAAIASHQCTDFIKNFEIPAYSFNDGSLLTCFSNDYGYHEAFERLTKIFARKGDLVFVISSSGQSENVLRAARAARALGATVVTLSGFKSDNPLRKLGHYNFYVPSSSYRYVESAHLHLFDFLVDHAITLKEA
ncbi:MAG TPA: SIS domain-containing protein [Candidatus Paceibacterota bacterium]